MALSTRPATCTATCPLRPHRSLGWLNPCLPAPDHPTSLQGVRAQESQGRASTGFQTTQATCIALLESNLGIEPILFLPALKGDFGQRTNERVFYEGLNPNAASTARCTRRQPCPDSFIRTIIHSKRLALDRGKGVSFSDVF